MIAQIKDVISQAKSGKPNFAQLLADAQKIMTDVQAAQTDCKLSKVGNLNDCTSDIAAIVTAATAIMDDINNTNFVKLITDVQSLVTAAKEAASDCTQVKRVGGLPQCINDVTDAVKTI
jgi:hypothetical protein